MNKAVFYKEWIKLRWYVIAMVITGIVLETIMFLKLGRSFRFAGHEHLWDVIINKNQFMFSYIKYYPLVTGLLFGAAQFVPEINSSRLMLSLHLPMKESRIVTSMIGFAAGILMLLYLIFISTLLVGASRFFAVEVVNSIFITVLPWFVAGVTAYLLLAFCAFEPTWKRKVVNVLISFFIVYLYFVRAFPGSYQHTIWLLMAVPAISMLFVYYSVFRFKIGIQATQG